MENLKESCWKLRMVTRYIFYPLNGVWIMNRDWTVSDTGNWILTLNRIFTSRWMGFFLFWLMLPFKTKPSKKKQAPVNDDERMRNRMLIFTIRKWQFPPVQLRQWMTEIYWTNGTNFPSWHLCKKKKKKRNIFPEVIIIILLMMFQFENGKSAAEPKLVPIRAIPKCRFYQ